MKIKSHIAMTEFSAAHAPDHAPAIATDEQVIAGIRALEAKHLEQWGNPLTLAIGANTLFDHIRPDLDGYTRWDRLGEFLDVLRDMDDRGVIAFRMAVPAHYDADERDWFADMEEEKAANAKRKADLKTDLAVYHEDF